MSVFLQPIYTQTASGSVSGITFNNIPQTFTDLKLVVSARATGSSASQGMYMQFNGSGSNIYSETVLQYQNNTVVSFRESNANAIRNIEIPNTLNTANIFSNFEIYFPNYTSSNYKSIIIDDVKENNATSTEVGLFLFAGLFSSTSAITSINLTTNITSPVLAAGSTFSLYGILRQGV